MPECHAKRAEARHQKITGKSPENCNLIVFGLFFKIISEKKIRDEKIKKVRGCFKSITIKLLLMATLFGFSHC